MLTRSKSDKGRNHNFVSMRTIAILIFNCLLTCATTFGQLKPVMYESGVQASFRGVSVVDNEIAWVSGSTGTVGKTTDGGKSWSFQTVKGFEQVDFRSLYGFDENKALVANAGSPGHILLTSDGGKSWKTVYSNEHEAAFFDGVDFWDANEGIIYGDPIDGKMLLLKTHDGGMSWVPVAHPPTLAEGEASFAASGTGIRCIGKNRAVISTGGVKSRLWISYDRGDNWETIEAPIVQGKNTTGIYSFAVTGASIILVGGDYTDDKIATGHNLYSGDFGQAWKVPTSTTRGYRECVEFVTKKQVVAVGPSGMDMSNDGGKNWSALNDEQGFHVVRKARKGSVIIAAGGNGQIATLSNLK